MVLASYPLVATWFSLSLLFINPFCSLLAWSTPSYELVCPRFSLGDITSHRCTSRLSESIPLYPLVTACFWLCAFVTNPASRAHGTTCNLPSHKASDELPRGVL